MTSGPCHAAGCSAQSPLPLTAATLLHVALHPPSVSLLSLCRVSLSVRAAPPRVRGMAERMPPDTRPSGQLFVISHTDSHTGGGQRRPQGPHGHTEEQREQWTMGGFVVTGGWHGPWFPSAPRVAVPGPAARTAVWLKGLPAGAAWGGFPGIEAARIGSSCQAWPHAPSSSPLHRAVPTRDKSPLRTPPRPCPQLRGARVTPLVLTSTPNTSPDLHHLLPKAEPTTQPLSTADACLCIKRPSALSVLDLCPAPTPSSCTSSVPTPCL